MSRKDYELIAGAIHAQMDDHEGQTAHQQAITSTAWGLADELEKDNSRFNKIRFLQACGVES